ncbi:general stress protein 26 [Devosia sp. 2618]
MATAASTPEKKPARRVSSKAMAEKPAAKKSANGKAATNAGAAKALKAKAATTKSAKPAKPAAAKATATKVSKRAVKPVKVEKAGKVHAEHVERIWDLAKKIGIAMFVTWDGKQQRARPLAATVEKDEGAIYFLIDVHGDKDEQLAEYPTVSVSFADHKRSKYVALSGKATVHNDREKIKDLWSPFAKAWWDSPKDPSIRVIKMIPQDAELWDSPGRVVTGISMLAAALTGGSPVIGENAKVVL